ncbi:MAG: 6-phospho-beta-glucosidase [Actinomycetota bacterium]
MKVTVLGGGGFRAPMLDRSLVWGAEAIELDEVVFYDTSEPRLRLIADVLRAMDDERGGGLPRRISTDLDDALDGAGAVFAAIRVGGNAGRIVDETVPVELGLLGQETVGPGGIAFALRTLPVMRQIATAAAARAPGAWFLNFTNPAGLVTEALRDILGDRAVGICDSPISLGRAVADALGRSSHALEFDYAGLNHLGWLLGVREDGRDVLPELLASERAIEVEEVRLFGLDRIRELGMVPNEYVAYYERAGAIVRRMRERGATRGQLVEEQQLGFFDQRYVGPADALLGWRRARDARHASYMDEAGGDRASEAPSQDEPQDEGYGAVAVGFLRAIATDTSERLILNTANAGRMPFLDDEAVVEAPSLVGRDGPAPVPVGELLPSQRELLTRVKEAERLTLRASSERSAELAIEAIARHPVVDSRPLAEQIFVGYLARQPGFGALFD